MKKIIVAGSRNFSNYTLLFNTLDTLISLDDIIVSGCADGPDSMAISYGEMRGISVEKYPAKWDDLSVIPCVKKVNRYGKAYNALAGYNRNREMLNAIKNNPDGGFVIAFWDGKSRGTADMIKIAKENSIIVKIISV